MSDRTTRLVTVLLLALLVGTALVQDLFPSPASHGSRLHSPIWKGFLFGLPVLLGLLVWYGTGWHGARWAFLACTMYGTIGLALDIATLVLAWNPATTPDHGLVTSLATGVLNLGLILAGGYGFLRVTPDEPPPGRTT